MRRMEKEHRPKVLGTGIEGQPGRGRGLSLRRRGAVRMRGAALRENAPGLRAVVEHEVRRGHPGLEALEVLSVGGVVVLNHVRGDALGQRLGVPPGRREQRFCAQRPGHAGNRLGSAVEGRRPRKDGLQTKQLRQ